MDWPVLAAVVIAITEAAGAQLRGQRAAAAEGGTEFFTLPPLPAPLTAAPSPRICSGCGPSYNNYYDYYYESAGTPTPSGGSPPPATVTVTTCSGNQYSTCTDPSICSDQLLVSINGGPDGTANMKDLGSTLGMSYPIQVPAQTGPVHTVRLARHGRQGLLDGWQICGMVVDTPAGTWTWPQGTGVWLEDSCPTNTGGFEVSFTWTWPSGNVNQPTVSPVVDCSDGVITHDQFPATPAPTGFPSRNPTGFPSGSPSAFPSPMPTQVAAPGSGPVQLSSCTAGSGYTVDGVARQSPCYLAGKDRHVDYVGAHGTVARLYTCSRGNKHHFVLCTCSGAVCAANEEPQTCFVPADNAMGCVGLLRGAAFSGDGTKAYFACSKEVRACRVDLSSRNGQWYSDCQVIQGAGCPRWAGIRGISTRPRPDRGDLLVVVCTDWKTRACSLDTDNMNMQPGRKCVKGGKETLCDGIGKPSAISFSSNNRLIVACTSGYSYSKFVGGIVKEIVHTAYNGAAPCPVEIETNGILELGSGRAAVACGPDGVRECQIAYP